MAFDIIETTLKYWRYNIVINSDIILYNEKKRLFHLFFMAIILMKDKNA